MEPKDNAEKTPVMETKQNLVYRYEEEQPTPEFLSQVWHKHWIMIIVAALDLVIILYSIIGIMKVGFSDAAGLFGIGIFIWFCITWEVIREYCGTKIFNWLIQPVVDWAERHWKYLKWYFVISSISLLLIVQINCPVVSSNLYISQNYIFHRIIVLLRHIAGVVL